MFSCADLPLAAKILSIFSSTKKRKFVKTINACTESTYLLLEALKNIPSRDTIPLRQSNKVNFKKCVCKEKRIKSTNVQMENE